MENGLGNEKKMRRWRKRCVTADLYDKMVSAPYERVFDDARMGVLLWRFKVYSMPKDKANRARRPTRNWLRGRASRSKEFQAEPAITDDMVDEVRSPGSHWLRATGSTHAIFTFGEVVDEIMRKVGPRPGRSARWRLEDGRGNYCAFSPMPPWAPNHWGSSVMRTKSQRSSEWMDQHIPRDVPRVSASHFEVRKILGYGKFGTILRQRYYQGAARACPGGSNCSRATPTRGGMLKPSPQCISCTRRPTSSRLQQSGSTRQSQP